MLIEGSYRTMTVFYAPDATFSNVLPEEESQHAIKVLRLQKGDKIMVVDGKGGCFLATITFPKVDIVNLRFRKFFPIQVTRIINFILPLLQPKT